MHWNVIFRFCVSALFINSVLELRTWRISMSHLFISVRCNAYIYLSQISGFVLCFHVGTEFRYSLLTLSVMYGDHYPVF
jgi:hypothetical protein